MKPAIGGPIGAVEAVCIGETMALVAPDPPVPLAQARTMTLTHGGAESNVAVSLARLGRRVQWCSRLGDDALGRRVQAELEAAGVDTSLVEVDAQARTGVYFKDPGLGATAILYYRTGSAASRMDERDFERAIAGRPRLLHVSGITPALSESCRQATRSGIKAARSAGITVSFDINYRLSLWSDADTAAQEMEELARMSDIVFVGTDEALSLWGTVSVEQIAERLAGPRTIIVKDGSGPASSIDAGELTQVPSLPVEVRELVGAGDAFAAGWLHASLLGLGPAERLRLGHLLAAETLGSPTDHAVTWPPSGNLEERARLDASWPADDVSRSNSGTV